MALTIFSAPHNWLSKYVGLEVNTANRQRELGVKELSSRLLISIEERSRGLLSGKVKQSIRTSLDSFLKALGFPVAYQQVPQLNF